MLHKYSRPFRSFWRFNGTNDTPDFPEYAALIQQNPSQEKEYGKSESTEHLQNSYAGILGKAIEPVIHPLG
jgi:hypothetical protein